MPEPAEKPSLPSQGTLLTNFPSCSPTVHSYICPYFTCTSFTHPHARTLVYNGIHHCAAALQIRLVGGGSNPFSGRVEYYLQGIWATVCDDYFGTADGNVVCNQLGYGNATSTPSFGAGSGSIAFDDLDCSGDEISLLFCPHLGNFEHNCGHNEDVGVTCEGKYDDGELCWIRLPRFPSRDICAIECMLACLHVHIHIHTHTHTTHTCTHSYSQTHIHAHIYTL